MPDRTHEERLAAHLAEGLACLRRGDPGRALLHLRPVVSDASLAAEPSLSDIRCRALTLCAQALVQDDIASDSDGLAALDEAEALLDEAQALDEAAHPAIADLRDTLLDQRTTRVEAAARAARFARLATMDVEPLLQRIQDPGRRLDLLLHKAQAELAAGRHDEAAGFAKRVLNAPSDDLRHTVLARLTMAAARPERAEEWLLEALERAESQSEFNLVGMVARTADHLGVTLPVQTGPTLVTQRASEET